MCEALGIPDMLAWGRQSLEGFLCAAFAHHGAPARLPSSRRGPPEIWRRLDDYDPIEAAQLLGRHGRERFPLAFETGLELPNSPALVHLFAGILTLAGQLGSNEEFFPHCPEADPAYVQQARKQALRAVAELGFRRDGWADDPAVTDFATTEDYRCVFGFDRPEATAAGSG